jgi:RNA polymerase sigma factor (sigma-70 family)
MALYHRAKFLIKRRRSKFAPAHEESLEGLEDARRDGLADPAPGPEQTAFGREVESALAAAIDALDPDQREVLVLRDIEGLTAPEVAQVIGLSVDAVKSRLHRARLAVRQRVAPVLGMSTDWPMSVGVRMSSCSSALSRGRDWAGAMCPYGSSS